MAYGRHVVRQFTKNIRDVRAHPLGNTQDTSRMLISRRTDATPHEDAGSRTSESMVADEISPRVRLTVVIRDATLTGSVGLGFLYPGQSLSAWQIVDTCNSFRLQTQW
jgi:hypothetical protein